MKLVIRPYRPRQRVLVVVGLVLTVIGATGIAYHYGRWWPAVDAMGAASVKRGIMDDYVELRRHNEKLLRFRGKYEKAAEIDDFVRFELQKTLSGCDLKSLIRSWSRDILSSIDPVTRPHVQGLKLRDYGDGGRYQYKLVLTHMNKDDKVVDGHVDVEI